MDDELQIMLKKHNDSSKRYILEADPILIELE